MKHRISTFILLVIIGLGIYLRFWHLDTNPVWYGDECIYTAVTQNLLNHQLRFESLNWTFFSAYLPQPPLFFLLSAISLSILNHGVLALRIITALAGIGTMLLLYLMGKEIQNKATGLWAAFLFTIYPLAVVYTRWAFPYPLGMFWIMLTVYFYFRYMNTKSTRYLYFAGITTALALLTIYYAFELVLFILAFMLFLKVDWKRIIAVLGIAVIPLFILFLIMFMVDRQSVLFDLKSILWRSSLELAPKHSFWSLLAGYKKLWLLDTFMFFGIIGLFFTKREYKPYLWLGFGCLSVLPIARQGIFLDIFFYPMVICLPFVILGLASLIIYVLAKTKIWIDQGIAKLPALTGFTKNLMQLVPLIIILILLIPFVIKDVRWVNTIFVNNLNYFATRNIQDTIATAEFINQHTESSDFVIAPSSVYMLLHCRYASLFQSVAYTGQSIEYYPANIPQYRFKYPCSYFWAKYMVIADIDRIDTLTKPAVKELWQKIQNDQWQQVFEQGEFEVYLNPLYKD